MLLVFPDEGHLVGLVKGHVGARVARRRYNDGDGSGYDQDGNDVCLFHR